MEEPYCLFAKEIICMYFRCSLDVVEIWKEKKKEKKREQIENFLEKPENFWPLLAVLFLSFSVVIVFVVVSFFLLKMEE